MQIDDYGGNDSMILHRTAIRHTLTSVPITRIWNTFKSCEHLSSSLYMLPAFIYPPAHSGYRNSRLISQPVVRGISFHSCSARTPHSYFFGNRHCPLFLMLPVSLKYNNLTLILPSDNNNIKNIEL